MCGYKVNERADSSGGDRKLAALIPGEGVECAQRSPGMARRTLWLLWRRRPEQPGRWQGRHPSPCPCLQSWSLLAARPPRRRRRPSCRPSLQTRQGRVSVRVEPAWRPWFLCVLKKGAALQSSAAASSAQRQHALFPPFAAFAAKPLLATLHNNGTALVSHGWSPAAR